MHLIQEKKDHLGTLILNRPEKYNAFNESLIADLTEAIYALEQDPDIYVILLKGNGKHFSSGADIAWMERMAQATLQENEADALKLAELLSALYHAKKPTVVQVQGQTYGGGLGLIAACDIAIAADNASFCFSEVKLGLIPAVISPYIIQAMGSRASKCLFMTTESFSAQEAKTLGLLQYCVAPSALEKTTADLLKKLIHSPPDALKAAKNIVKTVQRQPIDATLSALTAQCIAKRRQSSEAQVCLKRFLKK